MAIVFTVDVVLGVIFAVAMLFPPKVAEAMLSVARFGVAGFDWARFDLAKGTAAARAVVLDGLVVLPVISSLSFCSSQPRCHRHACGWVKVPSLRPLRYTMVCVWRNAAACFLKEAAGVLHGSEPSLILPDLVSPAWQQIAQGSDTGW